MRSFVLAALLLLTLPGFAFGATIFHEDFESGLGNWTGVGDGAHHGVIVADPDLLQSDSALAFDTRISGGDIFSAVPVFAPGTYILIFDYLGLPGQGGVDDDLGGYIGISNGLPGAHSWFEGTGNAAAKSNLVDDGEWHTYQVAFTTPWSFHIMAEDFLHSGGVAGDALFDNIYLTDPDGITPANIVPLPAPVGLAGLGLLSALLVMRRRRR